RRAVERYVFEDLAAFRVVAKVFVEGGRGLLKGLLVAQCLSDAGGDTFTPRLQVVLEGLAVALELCSELVDLLSEAMSVLLFFGRAPLVVVLNERERIALPSGDADLFIRPIEGARIVRIFSPAFDVLFGA